MRPTAPAAADDGRQPDTIGAWFRAEDRPPVYYFDVTFATGPNVCPRMDEIRNAMAGHIEVARAIEDAGADITFKDRADYRRWLYRVVFDMLRE
jgi:hypothetical protein